jgi:hypothetical protein
LGGERTALSNTRGRTHIMRAKARGDDLLSPIRRGLDGAYTRRMNTAEDIADMPTSAGALPARIARLRELMVQVRLWILECLLWLSEMLGDAGAGDALRAQLRCDLARVRDGVRGLLVMMAMLDAPEPPPTHGRRQRTFPHAPRGFRRRRHEHEMRNVTRGLRFRGRNLRGHFAALAAVIDNLDACVAHVRARLDPPMGAALIAVRPPPVLFASVAQVTPCAADSS